MKCLYCREDNEAGRSNCKKCGASLNNAAKREVKNIVSDDNLNDIAMETINNLFPKARSTVRKTKSFFRIIIIILLIGGFFYLKNNNFDFNFLNKNLEKKKVVDTDKPIKDNNYDEKGSFKLSILGIKNTDRGLSITGTIESGTIKTGDIIEIIRANKESLVTKVKFLQIFDTDADSAKAGDNVTIIVDNININDIAIGDIVAAPNTIKND